MMSQNRRQRWLKHLAGLLNGEKSTRRAARRPRVLLHLEELECRLTPSATVQFSVGSETVNASAGTFSIPVTLTGSPAPTFASGLFGGSGMAFDAAGNLYVANLGGTTVSKVTPGGVVTTFASGFNEPDSVAFDAAGNLYVANYGDSTVSKVTPGGVVSPFASGFDRPIGLAIDAAGNLYVANFYSTTVSKVTPGGAVTTFASGFFDPDGAAFDAAGNLYVANYGNGTVSKVTPGGMVSTYISGFPGVQGLAFDAAGNLYVTNTNGNTVNEVTPTLLVSTFASFGDPQTGLAIDAAGNLYVTDNGPTVSEFSTTVTVAFAQGGTAVSGTDYSGVTSSPLVFAPGQTTEDITGTLLSDPGASTTLTFTLNAPSGPAVVGSPAAITLSIDEPNPAPTLTSISPASATVADNETDVTLTGTNFIPSSTVEFNGTSIETFFDSATQLTAVIPANDLTTAHADSITVTNPGPGGGPSNLLTFTVDNPAPTLTSISPTSATLGDPDTTITLTGTNFIAGSTADFNGTALATTFISATQLTAVIPATDLTMPGQAPITVVTAGPGGGTSAAQTISFNAPAPILTSISPTSATAGSPDTTITLTGTGFVSDLVMTEDSFADFNGRPLATSFVSATQLTAVIPAADLTTAGTDKITVVTEGPSGGTSTPQTFAVNNLVPTLTNISPASATAGDQDATITLTGTNFVSGSTTADFNGAPIATTFVSATQLTAVIPAADLTAAGADAITVVTAGPGGGASAAQTFTVNEALTPNQRFLSNVYLDLLGRPIDPSALAGWNALLNAGVSRTQIVLDIENSPGQEFLHVEVNDAFMHYLKRDADAGGLTAFTNFLAGGGTVEQMDAVLVSSPEYQMYRANGTYQGFLTAFYQDALNRTPISTDPGASAPLTPVQAATDVFASPEFERDLAASLYEHYLDRAFGPGDPVRAGTPDGLEIAEIVGSDEYFNKTAP